MADKAVRQWLNVADDTENKKALNVFHEQVLRGTPVSAARSETRLFRLLPDEEDAPLAGDLICAQLDCQPVFEALSYTWGKSPERTHITLNAIPGFPITLNLAAALRRLRLQDRPCQLWVDAINIDQSNDDDHLVDNYTDEEFLDSDELEKLFMRTRKGLAAKPQVSLSHREKPQPMTGTMGISLATSPATVLDGLPAHCFAKWDRTKTRVVVDQVGTSQARAPPESKCAWKRLLTNVQRANMDKNGRFLLDPELLTGYKYQDDMFDEVFQGWRTYFGLPTSAAGLGAGWAQGVRLQWETLRGFQLGVSAKETVFFTTANGFVGVGLTNMAVGEYIVLLHRCNGVILLRQRSCGYDYEGTVYVHGISDGEVDDLFDSGAFSEEDRVVSNQSIST